MRWNVAKAQTRARTSSSVVAKVSSKIWQHASRSFKTVSFFQNGELTEASPKNESTPAHAPAESAERAPAPPSESAPEASGSSRYQVYGEIASGGMAVVQYGRLSGPSGFTRDVAIKRLHAQFARDPHFVAMFLDEARLSARVAHANVIPTLDVIASASEVSVVMEYVPGEALSGLLACTSARGQRVPMRVAVTLIAGTLHGLHAAHEIRSEQDELLNLVHRDVSPQNILVGSDGVARLIDFGIAKARGRSRVTPTGELKGKLAYMAPEQYRGEEVDRRVDVYGASVVLWEALTGRMLFDGPNDAAVARAVMGDEVPPPSAFADGVPEALDGIVLRGLARERDKRFASAREMALALEREIGVVPQSQVSDWVHGLYGQELKARAETVRQMLKRGEQTNSQPPHGTRKIVVSTHAGRHTRRLEDPALQRAITRPSEIKKLSGESSGEAKSARSRTRAWLLLLTLVAAGAVAYYALGFGKATPHAQGAKQSAVSSAPKGKIEVAPPPPAALPEDDQLSAPPAPVPPAPVEVSAPTGAAAVEQTVSEHKNRGTRSAQHEEPARKERGSKKGRAALDCSEPVEVDAMGIRRVKRECLRLREP
jgi:serine/threonine-protein kinase